MTAPHAAVELAPGGPRFSPIVAGAWRMAEWGLDARGRLRWIEECLALGVTTFDHADIYGDYQVERLFGEALALAPALRDRVQLVSKCGIKLPSAYRPAHGIKSYDTSPAHVTASVEASLRALRTDHLDLLLIHRPDPLMDAAELAATFRQLQRDGKVLHVGVSNHSPSQFALLHQHVPLVTNQVELSPLQRSALSDGTLDQCQALGIRPMIWSPLTGGRLFTGTDDEARRVRAALDARALDLGVSPTTLAYAWILRHPSRPLPITGSGRIAAMREATSALEVALAREDWFRLWRAGAGHDVA